MKKTGQMNKLTVIVLLLGLSFNLGAQKYVFDNKAEYQGTGLFQGKPKYGKYILYWSTTSQIIGLEIFDREGAFVAMTIFDPQNNKLIGLDEREKTGFQVAYNDYATDPVDKASIDSTNLAGKDSTQSCMWYEYKFSNGQKAMLCLTSALFNGDMLKILQRTGYAFMRVPYGFKGVISRYALQDKAGNQIADLKLTELRQGAYYTFDLRKYRIQRF